MSITPIFFDYQILYKNLPLQTRLLDDNWSRTIKLMLIAQNVMFIHYKNQDGAVYPWIFLWV